MRPEIHSPLSRQGRLEDTTGAVARVMRDREGGNWARENAVANLVNQHLKEATRIQMREAGVQVDLDTPPADIRTRAWRLADDLVAQGYGSSWYDGKSALAKARELMGLTHTDES